MKLTEKTTHNKNTFVFMSFCFSVEYRTNKKTKSIGSRPEIDLFINSEHPENKYEVLQVPIIALCLSIGNDSNHE